jgi:hypothetical protein
LLALAQRQGVLYAHQLPSSPKGARPEPVRSALAHILAGEVDQLEPLRPPALVPLDAELDEVQCEAVAKALATPDIFLVQGLPGTGKSRVVAEIVAQATARGEKVLLLAPMAAALDRVLDLVAGRATAFALRCLAPHEKPDTLPARTRALTFAERLRTLKAQALASARRDADSAAQGLQRLQHDEATWERLTELLLAQQRVQEQIHGAETRAAAVPGEVEQETLRAEASQTVGEFAEQVASLRTRRQETLAQSEAARADLDKQLETANAGLTEVSDQLQAITGLVAAKRQGHIWTRSWWQATFRGITPDQGQELEARHTQAQNAVEELQQRLTSLEQQCRQQEADLQRARAELMESECLRRQGKIQAQIAGLRYEAGLLQQKWHLTGSELSAAEFRPEAPSTSALEQARAVWRKAYSQAKEQQALAQQWTVQLEKADDPLAARLPQYVNLIAATVTGLAADPHFGDRAANGSGAPPTFDLLILEDADQLSEAEVLAAARRAKRSVLVGQTLGEPERSREADADRSRSATRTLRLSVFSRLWQILHSDPRRLPYAWVSEQNQLCCRLHTVTPDQRTCLESERVADYPDIELRILTLPRTQPQLAEIVFPSSMSIEQAKCYIYSELQELAVQASNHSLRWHEEAERLVLRLGDRELPHQTAIVLEPGIREFLGPVPSGNGQGAAPAAWHTCCLEFDRAAGWQRVRAEAWVEQYLRLRDLGRTIRLDVLHRMEPHLASFLAGLLGSGSELCLGRAARRSANGCTASVEFIAVPPLARAEGRRDGRRSSTEATLTISRKGGAGLELDLSDPRQRDRLPMELRGDLPNQGFVNLPEAQAVVRSLEALASQFAAAEQPQSSADPQPAPFVILALYPAQAELIRRLLRQSAVPSSLPVPVEVTVPALYQQREADVVLLSLTRSHTHRAVAFGEGPRMLALALTRARTRLLVFGDPGTLARRSQWEGPLEHLDDADAARERDLVAHLVRYLDGHGHDPRAFHFCQGNGS